MSIPEFVNNRHKVVRLSALRTGRFYPTGDIPGTRFCLTILNDPIGNRIRDLPAYSAVR